MQFNIWMQACDYSISEVLLKSLHCDYKLMDHLLIIKNIVLLGDAHFALNLLGALHQDLMSSGHNLYKHNLLPSLESCLK